MAVATCRTISLHGAVGHLIDVQADVSPGQAGLTMVGRPDASLSEARDRCRMAIVNSRLPWPATKRITILLSPADLPKRGTHFDLAIAVSVLAATTTVPPECLRGTAMVGELTLEGGLRSVPGVLPMVLAAAERGLHRVIVPEPQAGEAAMVPGMTVIGARSLAQVVAVLTGEEVPPAPPVAAMSGTRLLSWRSAERLEEVDMADLAGIADAKLAVEVAAAGGHHLMLSGPKGAGKTSIVERIPTILPPLTPEESLELTAIHSLAGALEPGDDRLWDPPFSAPHHDASKASLIGGGSGQVRPGELSRAHAGVLFLDEFPLFRTDVIDALRQPLESGEVTIARTEESVRLPAGGIVVLASNPCPCGKYHASPARDRCDCTEVRRRRYRDRITGPVADRIDITRHVEPLGRGELDPFAEPERSSVVRERVGAARLRQSLRYADERWRLNGQAPGPQLAARFALTDEATAVLREAVVSGRLSNRGATRVHRLAWTFADLAACRRGDEPASPARPGVDDVDLALRLRLGEPLPLAALHAPAVAS